MTEKLEKNEEVRKQLIGDVSHELRTPLSFIQASIEGIMDGIISPTAQTFKDIQEEIERLDRLVNDLHELSIIEAGTYTLEKKLTKITDILVPIMNQMKNQFKKQKIDLIHNIDPAIPEINIDTDRIKQVFTNILANAFRFTQPGGQISIRIQLKDKEFLLVSVNDSGIGIPKEHLGKIFSRFYRVDKSRSRDSGGSGIGLTIAKQLVEAHGGKIWAESAGNDQGTTIYFTLPMM